MTDRINGAGLHDEGAEGEAVDDDGAFLPLGRDLEEQFGVWPVEVDVVALVPTVVIGETGACCR